MEDEAPLHEPSLEEASQAFWVASYAKSVCESFIRLGHPNPEDFIDLCSALRDLEGKTIGGVEFHIRAEDLHELMVQEKEEDA